MRSRSENLTTLLALTPGMAALMWSRRAFSSAAFLTAFDESPTRTSGTNALRITLRQFPDDFAKIAHSCAVVPAFTCALLFANAIALRQCGGRGEVSSLWKSGAQQRESKGK